MNYSTKYLNKARERLAQERERQIEKDFKLMMRRIGPPPATEEEVKAYYQRIQTRFVRNSPFYRGFHANGK